MRFDFIDAPPELALKEALKTLRQLGALDNENRMTNVGEQMTKLPIEPRVSDELRLHFLMSIFMTACRAFCSYPKRSSQARLMGAATKS